MSVHPKEEQAKKRLTLDAVDPFFLFFVPLKCVSLPLAMASDGSSKDFLAPPSSLFPWFFPNDSFECELSFLGMDRQAEREREREASSGIEGGNSPLLSFGPEGSQQEGTVCSVVSSLRFDQAELDGRLTL